MSWTPTYPRSGLTFEIRSATWTGRLRISSRSTLLEGWHGLVLARRSRCGSVSRTCCGSLRLRTSLHIRLIMAHGQPLEIPHRVTMPLPHTIWVPVNPERRRRFLCWIPRDIFFKPLQLRQMRACDETHLLARLTPPAAVASPAPSPPASS